MTEDGLGIKQVTVDNWLEPETYMKELAERPADWIIKSITAEDWVQMLQTPHLDRTVPKNVRRLFEIARGTMAYGYFFYPIYGLSVQQLYRVSEAAVWHKCAILKAPQQIKTYHERLQWLHQSGVICDGELDVWHNLRRLRNFASHFDSPTIIGPGAAVRNVELTAQHLNKLFREN